MTIYRKADGRYAETELDDELVLMNSDTGEFFSLTDTGLDIWRQVDGARDADAIASELAHAYGATPDAIGADVRAFLGELEAHGFVEQDR